MAFNFKKFIGNFIKQQVKQAIEEHGGELAAKAGSAATQGATKIIDSIGKKVQ